MPKEALSSSSDANDFLVETFFMYRTWPPKDTCECAVPRDTWLTCLSQGRRNNSTPCCPLCGDDKKKVVTVLDGYMHSCLLHGSSPELQSRLGAGLMKEHGRTPLAFKHGAIAYQVGLPCQRPNSSSHGGSWLTSSMKKGTAEYYAQDHIAHVLGLEPTEMKILCKGKVLYPSAAAASESEISNRLVHESISVKAAASPPRLLVMGTPHAQQLKQPSHMRRLSWWQWMYKFTVSWLWWSYRSFLEPFLPQALRLSDKRD